MMNTKEQIQKEYKMRSDKTRHLSWSRLATKASKDQRERPIPLIQMQVYDAGKTPLVLRENITQSEARKRAFGNENYTPDMSNGAR